MCRRRGGTHAKGNVGEELGDGRGTKVDGLAVLAGSLNTVVVDGLLLPELVTAELESTLDRVADLMGSREPKTAVRWGLGLADKAGEMARTMVGPRPVRRAPAPFLAMIERVAWIMPYQKK